MTYIQNQHSQHSCTSSCISKTFDTSPSGSASLSPSTVSSTTSSPSSSSAVPPQLASSTSTAATSLNSYSQSDSIQSISGVPDNMISERHSSTPDTVQQFGLSTSNDSTVNSSENADLSAASTSSSSTNSHPTKSKQAASSKHLRVNSADPSSSAAGNPSSPSLPAASSQGSSRSGQGRHFHSLRETTPPHSFKSPYAPSSPATPVLSNNFNLYGNGAGPSSAADPSGSSNNRSTGEKLSIASHLLAKDKGSGNSLKLRKRATSTNSDTDMYNEDSRILDEDDDDVMKDSSDEDLYTKLDRKSIADALFNNNNNGDFFTKASVRNSSSGLRSSLSNTDLQPESHNPFEGTMPSTPSSAFFHTSQESHIDDIDGVPDNAATDLNYSASTKSASSSASSKSQQPFPLPVHKVLDAITPHISHYSDDDKITLLKGILSLTTRPVLSSIQEHISPMLKKDPFAYLPNEISLRIISFIDDPKTLARASQVSRLWYLILSDDLTWKELCKTHHYRRLSAAVSATPNLMRTFSTEGDKFISGIGNGSDKRSSIQGPNSDTNNDIATGLNDFVESQFYPEVMQHPVPTNYRSHFKHQYMLNTAWQSGGRLAAKYVISHSGVVTSLIMDGNYIVFALDNSKIFVFGEDGKLLRSLFGHVMGVWALTLYGDTLVSGGCDRDVRVWNLKTGECLQILRGHQSTVRCLQMANSKTAVSGSRDTSVRVWDIEAGRCLHTLNGHTSSVRCIEIKGDICVSGSYDCTAKIWRISDGQLLHTLTGHISQIYSLAFDGNRVATGSLDASIRVWDANTGAVISILPGHTSLVSQLQMKGDTLVSGGSDGAVRVWDLTTYKCVHRLAAHDNSVTSLQFDDYRIVSGGSDGRVKVWDMATGLHVRELSSPYNSVWRIAFKDEKLAILASRNQQIHFKLISFSPQKEPFDEYMREVAKRRLDSIDEDGLNSKILDGMRSGGNLVSSSLTMPSSSLTTSTSNERRVDESIILGSSHATSSAPVSTSNLSGNNLPLFPTIDSGPYSISTAGPIPSREASRPASRNGSGSESTLPSVSILQSAMLAQEGSLHSPISMQSSAQDLNTGSRINYSLAERWTLNGSSSSRSVSQSGSQPTSNTGSRHASLGTSTGIDGDATPASSLALPLVTSGDVLTNENATSTPVSNITSTPTHPPHVGRSTRAN